MGMFHGSTKNNLLKSSSGQFAIEAVLLMTVLVGLFLLVTNYARDHKLLQNFAKDTVVDHFKTMSAYGTWKANGCTSPGKSTQTLGKCHPNSINRSLSSAPGE